MLSSVHNWLVRPLFIVLAYIKWTLRNWVWMQKLRIYEHCGTWYECKSCESMNTTELGMNVKAANLWQLRNWVCM